MEHENSYNKIISEEVADEGRANNLLSLNNKNTVYCKSKSFNKEKIK